MLALCFFFFQAKDGIRSLVRSRGLGDVYKRQPPARPPFTTGRRRALRALGLAALAWPAAHARRPTAPDPPTLRLLAHGRPPNGTCLLYTSDAADERSSADLGGRRLIKKKTTREYQADSNKSKDLRHIRKKRH